MSVLLRVTGYDKQTERLSVEHVVPDHLVLEAKHLAHVGESDDGLGAYPLEPAAAVKLGLKIDHPLNADLYHWFLEPR